MRHPFIQITRHLYEEPHHVNLVIIASNGFASGSLEFYMNATEIKELGQALEKFPSHDQSVHLFELGSERPEDNFGHYLRLRVFANNSKISCRIQIRLNNNVSPNKFVNSEQPQLTDFVIETETKSIQKLGKSLKSFAKLNQQRLFWSLEKSFIDNELEGLDRRTGDNVAAALASLPN